MMPIPTILRIVGVVLGTYLFVHYLGIPYGLLAGCSLAMLFLP